MARLRSLVTLCHEGSATASRLAASDTEKLASVLSPDGNTKNGRNRRRFAELLQLGPADLDQPSHVLVARRWNLELARSNHERAPDVSDRRSAAGERLEPFEQS